MDVEFVPKLPLPVIDHSDETVLFTGATINAVKFDVLSGQMPVPGNLLGQDCVRLQNLKSLGDPDFAPEYMSCFRMFSVCAHPSGQNALAEGSSRFLLSLKQRWGATIAVSCHAEQAELMRIFNIARVADSVHPRPQPMTWTFGMGNLLTGAGVDVMVGRGERPPRSTGQLVQLYCEGKPAGYEFGFGLETLGAAVSGGIGPFDAGELAEITTGNNEPLGLQLADTIVTLQRLYDAGLRPGHDSRGSTMRKMLRLLPAVAERVGFSRDQVLALFGQLHSGQPADLSASLASLVAESWTKRDKALELASTFIANQRRLCRSGAQSTADAVARSDSYLARLGKLLPIEVDELVRNVYPP